jgi:hypothetical protein
MVAYGHHLKPPPLGVVVTKVENGNGPASCHADPPGEEDNDERELWHDLKGQHADIAPRDENQQRLVFISPVN